MSSRVVAVIGGTVSVPTTVSTNAVAGVVPGSEVKSIDAGIRTEPAVVAAGSEPSKARNTCGSWVCA